MFTPHGQIALGVTAAVFVILQVRRGTPVDLLFLSAMAIVTMTGVITPAQALAGFANPAVVTIGSLLVVASALSETGVLDWIGQRLLGKVENEGRAFYRLALTLISTSAFLLNTALVAMMAPVVVDWCRRRGVSPSRLLIPVSYLTILGGVCTLIGTSTTLIVNGMLRQQYDLVTVAHAKLTPTTDADELASRQRFRDGVRPMSLFEIGRVGLPCAIAGCAGLFLVGRRFLPDRRELIEQLEENRREYIVEMLIRPECRLTGQTVEAAGLRDLPGLYLIEIDRNGEIVTPVGPDDVLRAGDRLVFAGVVSTIVDLEKIPGFVPATSLTYNEPGSHDQRRHLIEAVLSRSSPLIGTTIKAANFRRRYNAAVIAVHRNGERLQSKLGEIALEPGDTLLLQTREDFVAQHRNNPDFYLVSSVEGYSQRRHERAWIAALLSVTLIAWLVVTNVEWVQTRMPMFASSEFPAIAGICIASLLIMTRCIAMPTARDSLNLQVLLTIVGALGLGKALETSGAAHAIAVMMVDNLGSDPMMLLIVLYGTAALFTELITNNAVATILLPLAISVAQQADISPRPLVMAIALSASLSFLTPIGYQTNLMVMGPGGYRSSDYVRVGLPVAIAVATTAILLIPRVWPF
ncbi:MAG: anion permease [Planctomycetales bacterium]|nr:anion permease [Planctomycetales bacterium]